MAFNGKYVSSKIILDEVFRDNGYTIELPWEDALEWIGDALDLISVPAQYIPTRTVLQVEEFKTKLPCNFHELTQVAGSFGGCYPFPMLSSTNTFHPTGGDCAMSEVFNYMNGEIDPTQTSQMNPIGQDIAGNPVYEIFAQDDIFAINKNNVVVSGPIYEKATYTINNDFIFTNFKEGKVFLAYKAFPVDEEGFPVVPDNRKVIEAVKAFIRMKIDFKLYRKGDITRDIYEDAKQEYAWYIGAAQNSMRIPTLDRMESIKNMQKLIQGRFHHDSFYKNLNK